MATRAHHLQADIECVFVELRDLHELHELHACVSARSDERQRVRLESTRDEAKLVMSVAQAVFANGNVRKIRACS